MGALPSTFLALMRLRAVDRLSGGSGLSGAVVFVCARICCVSLANSVGCVPFKGLMIAGKQFTTDTYLYAHHSL